MKKFVASFLVFLVFALYSNLFANEKKGAEILIQRIDGEKVRGELIAVKQNSLLLKERNSGADVTEAVGEIRTITVVKKSKVLEQGGMGLLIGGAVGVATCTFALYFGTVIGIAWETYEGTEIFVNYALPYGLLGGGIIGALIGVVTGASAGKDETLQMEGKSETEIRGILENLRKKARIPDFQ